MAEKKYPKPVLHDDALEKVSEDVYCAHGCFKMGPGLRVSNTMTIVRRDGDLTIVNSIRVKPALEEEIKKLGAIKNIVRLSSNHGAADEYWIDTYKDATYWDVPGAATSTEKVTKVPATEHILSDGGELPGVPGSKVLVIKNLKMPDSVAWIPDGKGMLLCVDFIQDGRPGAPYETGLMRNIMMPMLGFKKAVCTPAPFMKFNNTGEDMAVNVEPILALEFDTLVPAHGRVIRGVGKDLLKVGWGNMKKGPLWKCPSCV